jgi:hypothetical protein
MMIVWGLWISSTTTKHAKMPVASTAVGYNTRKKEEQTFYLWIFPFYLVQDQVQLSNAGQ